VKKPSEMLTEFQATFQTPNTPEFWLGLVREESAEVDEAVTNLLKEYVDYSYVVTGAILAGATLDQINEATGHNIVAGLVCSEIPDEVFRAAFRRVHANNMSKVHADGTVRRREDGKVLKPEGYQPCDLSDLVR